MIHVLEFVVAGVMAGALYGLVAVGLNLIFGVMRFINLAHGEMLTVGAYASIMFAILVGGGGGPVGSVAAAVGTVLLLGVALERTLISSISQDGRFNPQRALVLTLGLSMFLSNVALAIFGADYRRVPGALTTGVLHIGAITLEGQRLVVFVGSILLSALLMSFLYYTRTGLAMRAAAQNAEAAMSSGIDIRRVQTLTFALGSALAGAAGALVTPITYAYPAMGFPQAVKAFIVVIIGGLGNVWGALLAGYLLGVAESLSVLWLPSGYNALVGPVVMLLVLILRPEGLFGRNVLRK